MADESSSGGPDAGLQGEDYFDELVEGKASAVDVPPPPPFVPQTPTPAAAEPPTKDLPVFSGGMPTHPHKEAKSQTPRRRKWKVLFAAAAGLVLLGGVAVAAAYVIPGLLEKPPYDTGHFVADLSQHIAQIQSASYTVSVSAALEDRAKGDRSFQEAYPSFFAAAAASSSSAIMDFYRHEQDYMRYIPSPMNVALTVRGIATQATSSPEGQGGFGVNATWGDFSVTADIDVLFKNGVTYVRINHMPSFFFFNPEPVKGKWIQLTAQTIANSMTGFAPSMYSIPDPLSHEHELETLKALVTAADDTQVLSVSTPVKDTLNGASVYRYDATFDPKTFPDFFQEFASASASIMGQTDAQTAALIAHNVQALRSPVYQDALAYYRRYLTFSVWVDATSKLPVAASLSFVYVPDGTDPNPALLGKRIHTTVRIDLANINKPVNVQAPETYLTYDDAVKLLTGQTVSQLQAPQSNAAIEMNLESVRTAAELYYNGHNGYAGRAYAISACPASSYSGNDLFSDPVIQQAISNIMTTNASLPSACAANSESYAVAVPLVPTSSSVSSDSYFCIDSSGNASAITAASAASAIKSSGGAYSCAR